MPFDILFTEYQHFKKVEEDNDDLLIRSYSEYIASIKPKPIKIYRNYCLRCIDIVSHQREYNCKPSRQGHDFLSRGIYLEFSVEDVRHTIISKKVDIESIHEYCIDDGGNEISVEEMIRLNNR
ncbi:MAG: hypothetical protein H6551_07215 [Chitinophagales bacterium]|nr:hypothetical protein [Chitinophagales bacterium]